MAPEASHKIVTTLQRSAVHSCPNTVAVVGLEYRAKSWDIHGILNMSVSFRLNGIVSPSVEDRDGNELRNNWGSGQDMFKDWLICIRKFLRRFLRGLPRGLAWWLPWRFPGRFPKRFIRRFPRRFPRRFLKKLLRRFPKIVQRLLLPKQDNVLVLVFHCKPDQRRGEREDNRVETALAILLKKIK